MELHKGKRGIPGKTAGGTPTRLVRGGGEDAPPCKATYGGNEYAEERNFNVRAEF